MSRRDGVNEEELKVLVDDYKDKKDEESKIKKLITPIGNKIKDYMKNLPRVEDEKGNSKCSFSTDKWTATCTYTRSTTLNEYRTIEHLRQSLNDEQFKEVVKTKEYLDEDALEKLIYNGIVKAEDLLSCEDVGKEVCTLRISKKKED